MISLIAIGCSLGGLDAMSKLLAPLEGDFPAPIVAVQHRGKDSGTALCSVLSSRTGLRVVEAEDKMPLTNGCLHLAPPDYHLLVEDGACLLSADPPVRYARPSIEVLFESVAWNYGSKGLLIAMTSASSDGAAAAALARSRGATLFVQSPEDCEAPLLPRSVLNLTEADLVAPTPELAKELRRLAAGSAAERAPG